jgi:lantibiotic modifying enzyme
MNDRPWEPLLHGAAAEEAWRAIEEIAKVLRESREELVGGVAYGAAGRALFFHALDCARPGLGHDEDALRFLEIASVVTDQRLALHTGSLGVVWVIERIAGEWDRGPDLYDELDELVSLQLETWPLEEYDLVSGLVGAGVYSLRRLPRPRAVENLSRIVARLVEAADPNVGRSAWLTSAERARVLMSRAAYPYTKDVGYHDLGLAHGAAGVIAFLGALVATPHAPAAANRLLSDATTWLLAKRDPSFGFASWHYPGEPLEASRSAWCYGNPGVGIALMAAGRGARREEWLHAGIEVLSKEARRPPDQCGVLDASLCHGSTGLAHIYNRAFQATARTEFANAARDWATRTVEQALAKDCSRLTGASGIGLGLLSMVASSAPIWDGVLLTDLHRA